MDKQVIRDQASGLRNMNQNHLVKVIAVTGGKVVLVKPMWH